MRTIAAIVILVGTVILLFWYGHTEDKKKFHALEQENAELRQKNKVLHDIIDKKYLTIKPKPGV
jgi:fatty acid desaturase